MNARRFHTSGSLPKARQWLEWLAYHLSELPGDHGWIAETRDLTIELHHAIVTAARRLRGNPVWDIQGTMTDDTERLEVRALRLAHQASGLTLRPDIPERFRPLVQLVEGACNQQVRLAHEIDLLSAGRALQIELTTDARGQRLIEAG